MEENKKTLSQRLADFIVDFDWDRVSPEMLETARIYLTDTFACLIAGLNSDATRISSKCAKKAAGVGVSTILGSGGIKTDPFHAALVNGISAHAEDYDDVSHTMMGHPSAGILPAVMAFGEARKKSGREILLAYITGIETDALVGTAFIPEHVRNGWHTTGSIGIFGATAACCKLAGLGRAEIVNALGIAASEAAGLKGNTGTMSKPLHAGSTAGKGILATVLAESGFDARPDIFEIPGGYTQAFCSEIYHEEALLRAIDQWKSEFFRMNIKPWPTCRGSHNAIEAMLGLVVENDLAPEDIAHVECLVQPFVRDLLRYGVVEHPFEGRFSMNYVVALAAARRRVGMVDFAGDTVDPILTDLMKRVTMTVDETLAGPGVYFNNDGDTEVIVTLKNGKELRRRVNYAKGDPKNPTTWSDIVEKLKDCEAVSLDPEKAAGLPDLLLRFEQLERIDPIIETIEQALKS